MPSHSPVVSAVASALSLASCQRCGRVPRGFQMLLDGRPIADGVMNSKQHGVNIADKFLFVSEVVGAYHPLSEVASAFSLAALVVDEVGDCRRTWQRSPWCARPGAAVVEEASWCHCAWHWSPWCARQGAFQWLRVPFAHDLFSRIHCQPPVGCN